METAGRTNLNSTKETDITAVWERTKKRLDRMTKEETLKTFVSAGILTHKGNPTRPYRGVFVKVKG